MRLGERIWDVASREVRRGAEIRPMQLCVSKEKTHERTSKVVGARSCDLTPATTHGRVHIGKCVISTHTTQSENERVFVQGINALLKTIG